MTSIQKRRLKRKAGYSLLEILIVISIIALIVTLVGPQLFKTFGGAQSKAAATQMNAIKTSLGTLNLDIGRYPTEAEGLSLLVQSPGEGAANWNGPYMSKVPSDPWGVPFHYLPPAEGGEPKIMTLGKDNKEGGTGENADITL